MSTGTNTRRVGLLGQIGFAAGLVIAVAGGCQDEDPKKLAGEVVNAHGGMGGHGGTGGGGSGQGGGVIGMGGSGQGGMMGGSGGSGQGGSVGAGIGSGGSGGMGMGGLGGFGGMNGIGGMGGWGGAGGVGGMGGAGGSMPFPIPIPANNQAYNVTAACNGNKALYVKWNGSGGWQITTTNFPANNPPLYLYCKPNPQDPPGSALTTVTGNGFTLNCGDIDEDPSTPPPTPPVIALQVLPSANGGIQGTYVSGSTSNFAPASGQPYFLGASCSSEPPPSLAEDPSSFASPNKLENIRRAVYCGGNLDCNYMN